MAKRKKEKDSIDESSSTDRSARPRKKKKKAAPAPESEATSAEDGAEDGAEDEEESSPPSADAEADAREEADDTVEGDGDDPGGDDDDDDSQVAGQLGIEKYVIGAFFAVGILGAYVVGRFIHLVWSNLSTSDWFSEGLPALAAIPDGDKLTYATIVGGLISLIAVIRGYRSPRIRDWTDEVAGELSKVAWPSKKDVTNYTITVVAATAVAVTYLALLDRLWGFVTNLVYGTGS